MSSLRVLKADEVLAALQDLRSKQPVKFWAFYSSQLGGVVTDPALMVLPFDDHMVHRGHGIFDTAGIVNGKIYDLDAHLDRFLRSAERSKLKLPGPPPGARFPSMPPIPSTPIGATEVPKMNVE